MASSARIDELRKKFEENPRRYFAPLANEYRKAGDIEQAIAICREYLPQQPGHMSGHIVYGQALYEAGQYEEARTVFETALALDPENLIALRHLGDIALIVGNIDGARVWYSRVLEADPRNEEIQAQLKSLEDVPSSAAPTPMSTPAVQPPAAAAASGPAAMPPAAPEAGVPAPSVMASLPALELTMPMETSSPADISSSAATVVTPAIPMPAVDRTVEIPETPQLTPVESLSTSSATEITLDQVPVPAVPELEKAAEPPAGDLPVEKAPGFEPTGATTSSELVPPPAAGLEATPPPPSEAPPIDSFTLDGLETTSMTSPASSSADATPSSPEPLETPAAAEPTPPPDLEMTAPPVVEPSAAAVSEQGAAPVTAPEAPSADLPFIDVGEAQPRSSLPVAETASGPVSEPAPEHVSEIAPEHVSGTAPEHVSEPVPEPAIAESKPFVTETMAELYEQQGHRDEALRVYRALLDQRPDDEHLRSRIEKLEGKRGPTIRELLSRVAARRPSAQLKAAPTTEEIAPAATASSPKARTDVLGQLFGNAPVGGNDENAAQTLAAAFANGDRSNGGGSSQHLPGTPARTASKDLSLDAVFGSDHAPAPAASSFSFDQFFSERATAELPIPGARTASEGQETKNDVAKFTQWLEGLKQR